MIYGGSPMIYGGSSIIKGGSPIKLGESPIKYWGFHGNFVYLRYLGSLMKYEGSPLSGKILRVYGW